MIWSLCEGFKLPGSSVHCLCNCGWQPSVELMSIAVRRDDHGSEGWSYDGGHTDFNCSGFEKGAESWDKDEFVSLPLGQLPVSSWDLWTYFCVSGCPFSKGIQWTVLGFWFIVTGWLVFCLWETIEAFFSNLKGRWATDKQLWRCHPCNIGSYFCDLIMNSEMCCWLGCIHYCKSSWIYLFSFAVQSKRIKLFVNLENFHKICS